MMGFPELSSRSAGDRHGFRRLSTVCLFISAMPATASAQERSSVGRVDPRVAACIHIAATGSPWLEKTLWALRDQEKGWVGAEVLNSDGSHDLGPLQVNSSWAPSIARMLHRPTSDVYRWLRDDPCFNTGIARWIFGQALISHRGNYWRAIGIYHSPTTWQQQRYAISVAARLRDRFGASVFRALDRSVLDEGGQSGGPVGASAGGSHPPGATRETVYGFGTARSASKGPDQASADCLE